MNSERYSGSCHCGAVRFTANADLGQTITCNCSICRRTGAILAFVPANEFTLVSGADALSDYQFGRKSVHHLFCRTCGVRPFGRGTGPDGREMVAINVRCLDDVDLAKLRPVAFDGASL
ncbi:MAG: GFA family protein [Hyphomicrobiaceae bacterium]|nr:GFA family protein [Hyphomicrobiaceae bacterium]